MLSSHHVEVRKVMRVRFGRMSRDPPNISALLERPCVNVRCQETDAEIFRAADEAGGPSWKRCGSTTVELACSATSSRCLCKAAVGEEQQSRRLVSLPDQGCGKPLQER